ncbi:MAG TPA: aldo/keto reductase, partial [Armatimonadota bacterium]|nr:aldo/keto reductase [Armatimonadota bacterium]
DYPPSGESRMTRRVLLRAGTAAMALSGGGGLAHANAPATARTAENGQEWRNKQAGMAYRRLGRTGMMVSEVVCGGDPIKLDNYRHLQLAVEMGLNYLDMAPAYNDGDTERAYGKLISEAPVNRDRVYLTTKISGFTQMREQKYEEIFKGLPGGKQEAVRKRALELREARAVEKPGYFLTYFPGQGGQLDPAYLRVAMMAEYRHQVEGDPAFRRFITESLEGSLKRLGTDHVDIMMCPHGATTPEELRCPEIVETFSELKRAGKVRFLGVSAHNDPAAILRAATESGDYDVVMLAYNVINGGYLEEPLRQAAAKGVGVVAMKVAHAVATHHKALQPVPDWRVQMINRVVPGDMKAPVKAYLWALQNPHISAVISNLWDEAYVRENLAIAGKKIELRSA